MEVDGWMGAELNECGGVKVMGGNRAQMGEVGRLLEFGALSLTMTGEARTDRGLGLSMSLSALLFLFSLTSPHFLLCFSLRRRRRTGLEVIPPPPFPRPTVAL